MLEIVITNLIWVGVSILIAVWWYHWGYQKGKSDEYSRWVSLLDAMGLRVTWHQKDRVIDDDNAVSAVQVQNAD